MKTLLIVGSGSYLAKSFMEQYATSYTFITLQRNHDGDVKADLTVPEQIEGLKLPTGIPGLDGVLFFQGLNPERSAKESDWSRMQEMFALNLSAPVYLIKHFIRNINQGATVIFFSSVAAVKGSYDPSYAAAKSGIRGLMKSLSNEFSDIRFNTISLGLVEGSPVERGMTDDFIQGHKNRMFNNQLIHPATVGSTIHWILENPGIHRSEISLDGGFKI